MASILLVGLTMLFTLWWAARFVAVPGGGAIALDNFRWFADVVILLGTLFTIGLSMDDNMRTGITAAETHVLVLLASSGMMLLVAARDLMIVFLGIELMSISVYALAGINRRSERSAEGALKYFLLGAFSTAFLLYGIALVYGATGTTSLTLIAERTVAVRSRPKPAARRRNRADARRLRLQGRHRAVPHVGAGRLRRSAVADHRVHGGDGQGGGVRGVPPRVARGVPARASRPGYPPSAGSPSRR